jgi:hypothetical protein
VRITVIRNGRTEADFRGVILGTRIRLRSKLSTVLSPVAVRTSSLTVPTQSEIGKYSAIARVA